MALSRTGTDKLSDKVLAVVIVTPIILKIVAVRIAPLPFGNFDRIGKQLLDRLIAVSTIPDILASIEHERSADGNQ